MRDGSVMAHSDLVEFLSGSTDSAINFSGSVDLHIPIHPPRLLFSLRSGIACMLMFWFKDGAFYCYCAYVLRISRYSDFLSPMLTNTGIFLRGLKLWGERRS